MNNTNSNYTKKVFGKDKEDLIIDDLAKFFSSPQEETSVLEFKEGKVEIIDLYKEIVAFLNTEGGLLIIGTPREKKERIGKNEKNICQGSLTYSKFKNKDWLYQKINTNISPSPINISITEFISDEGAVFLIDVPQSSDPPHQCSTDGKYYIRLEREAKFAPHGIVQALFLKRKAPKLVSRFEIQPIDEDRDNILINFKNESNIPADKVAFIINIYNVREAYGYREITRNLDIERSFFISDSSNKVLVRMTSIPIRFEIRHLGQEYIIFVGIWCKDSDFSFKFGTYDPNEKEFVCSGIDDNELCGQEIDRIYNSEKG